MFLPEPMVYSAYGLVVLRLSLAAVFWAHGAMKRGMLKMSAAPQGMTPGMFNIMKLLAVAEPLGALGMLFGFLTQYAAAGLCLVMLGAMYLKITKWQTPFASLEKNGWELDLILFAGALMVLLAGPGMLALDLM